MHKIGEDRERRTGNTSLTRPDDRKRGKAVEVYVPKHIHHGVSSRFRSRCMTRCSGCAVEHSKDCCRQPGDEELWDNYENIVDALYRTVSS